MGPGPDDRPLPYGWTQQHDPASDHVFYVDTKATPPRSIWVHPYDDPQFLAEHPDVREKVQSDTKEPLPPNDELPAYEKEASSSSHRQDKAPEKAAEADVTSPSNEAESSKGKEKEKKRGMFSKMKDAALGGTKEEREAAKKRDQEWAASRRQQRMAYAPQYGSSGSYQPGPRVGSYPGAAAHYGPPPPPQFQQHPSYGPGPSHSPHPGYSQYPQPGPQQYQAPYPPPQGPYYQQGPHQQGPYGPPHHGPPPQVVYTQQHTGGGSGSMAVPIVGGLAAGALLGSLFAF